MQVRVLLFAIARERVGRAEVRVDLPDAPTVADLKASLAVSFPELTRLVPSLKIAINAEYAHSDDQAIPPAAELAAIPPVSGGSSASKRKP